MVNMSTYYPTTNLEEDEKVIMVGDCFYGN